MTEENLNPQAENDTLEQDLIDSLKSDNIDEDEEILEQEESEVNQEEVEVEETVEEGEQEVVDELPPLEPNDLWDENQRAAFGLMNREGQQAMIDTYKSFQTGYNEKFNELADQRRSYEDIQQTLAPIEPVLRSYGMSVSQGVGMLAQHIQNITQDPIAGTHTFLKAAGVDINQLTEQAGDTYTDPKFDQLQQQNQYLQQQINNFQQAQQSVQTQQLQQQIDAFANQANEQGHLMYPNFNENRQVMGKLISSGAASSLEQAYQMVEFSKNGSKAPQVVKQEPVTEKKIISKKVAKNNVKSKANMDASQDRSLRDDLIANMRALKGA